MIIGIIGLGYVGLPRAVAYAAAGHNVIGPDSNETVDQALRLGGSHIEDIPSERTSDRSCPPPARSPACFSALSWKAREHDVTTEFIELAGYHDPYGPEVPRDGLRRTDLESAVRAADLAVIVTASPGIDHGGIASTVPTVDLRGVTRTVRMNPATPVATGKES